MELKDIKNFLKELKQDDFSFDTHFYKRAKNRPVNEGMVRNFLSQIDKLEKIEHGKSRDRFKLWFKMSNKYSLVLIIEVILSKSLKVISAWNSDKKWQKKLKQ